MKKCYIISFDLEPGRSYASLRKRIKEYGTWAKITESTWAVVTTEKVSEVRSNLSEHLSTDDRIFIIKSGGRAAWRNVVASSEWLKKYISLP